MSAKASMSGKNSVEGEGVNVQVLLRCRPLDAQERASGCQSVITYDGNKPRDITLQRNIGGKQVGTTTTFKFDKVFRPECTQADLYGQSIQPIVKEMLEGFNCTIFAYGQTGTGKTYTMTGGLRNGGEEGELAPAAGVIPRAIQQIFRQLEETQGENIVKCSYLELYNEELIDLLAPEVPGKERPLVHIATDAKDSVVVRGQEEIIVRTAADIFALLDQGTAKRRTEKTLLNAQSSRSHSVFCVTAHMTERQPDGEDVIKIGKLYLVDLAGSESAAKSGAVGARASEASCINKSLLVLGRVITALVEKSSHIPHRESKLTRLLKDSLGGYTKTCIIATIAPTQQCVDETANTLIYAARAKNIRNRPVVNQVISKAQHIKEITSEIDKLKSELLTSRQKDGVFLKLEAYEEMQYNIEDLERRLGLAVEGESTTSAELETTQGRLEEESAALAAMSTALDDKAAELLVSQGALAEAREGLQQRDFLLAAHDKAGIRQQTQAHKLRKELGRTACELGTVFDKVEQQSVVEKNNASCVGEVNTLVASGLQGLHASIKGRALHQEGLLTRLSELLAAHLQCHTTANEATQAATIELRKRLTEAAESVASATRNIAASSGRSLQEMVEVHSQHLTEVATETSAAVEAVATAQQPLAAALERLDELRAAAADRQQADAAVAEELQQLLDSTCRSLCADGDAVQATLTSLEEEQEQQQSHLDCFKTEMADALTANQAVLTETIRNQYAILQQQTESAIAMARGRGQKCEEHRDVARKQVAQLLSAEQQRIQVVAGKSAERAGAGSQLHEQWQVSQQNCLADSRQHGLTIQSTASRAMGQQLTLQQDAHTKMVASATARAEDLTQAASSACTGSKTDLDSVTDSVTCVAAHIAAAFDATGVFTAESAAICSEARSHMTGLCNEHYTDSAAIRDGACTMIQQRYQSGVPTDNLPERRLVLVPSKEYVTDLWAPTPAEALADFMKQHSTKDEEQSQNDGQENAAATPQMATPMLKRPKTGLNPIDTPLRSLEINRQASLKSIKRRRTEAI